MTDATTWDRVATQFLAEREISSRWPGFESQVLFEFLLERCLLTLTAAADGFPQGHSIWRPEGVATTASPAADQGSKPS